MFKYLHVSFIIYFIHYEGKSSIILLASWLLVVAEDATKERKSRHICRVECNVFFPPRLFILKGKLGEAVTIRLHPIPGHNSKHLISLSLQNTDLFAMIERMQVRRLSGFPYSSACLSRLPMLHFAKQTNHLTSRFVSFQFYCSLLSCGSSLCSAHQHQLGPAGDWGPFEVHYTCALDACFTLPATALAGQLKTHTLTLKYCHPVSQTLKGRLLRLQLAESFMVFAMSTGQHAVYPQQLLSYLSVLQALVTEKKFLV